MTLAHKGTRPDGTQGDTIYQVAGHSVSACYLRGAMACAHCHDPHEQRARDLADRSAAGRLSDRQCTACHRKYLRGGAARSHSLHGAEVRCVDCHMAYSWMFDDPGSFQRTSDHSVSVPRPQETIDLGLPNACSTCHDDQTPEWALDALRRWGQTTALVTRGWVRTVAEARRQEPGSVPRLLELLADDALGEYQRASALALLARQPPEPAAAPALRELAHDPSPDLRSRALAALIVHDPSPPGDEGWLGAALRDPHPFVRITAVDAARDEAWLGDDVLRRSLSDRAGHTLRPTVIAPFVVRAAKLYLRRGDRRRSRAYYDLARRWTTPAQAAKLQLDHLGWLIGRPPLEP